MREQTQFVPTALQKQNRGSDRALLEKTMLTRLNKRSLDGGLR